MITLEAPYYSIKVVTILREFGVPFVDIEGGFSERRAKAAAAVDQLLDGADSQA